MVSKQQIKLVSINTWKCDGEYRKRIALLAKQLAVLKPDIIACQECFVSQETNTLKFLAEKLGMNKSYLPGRKKKRFFEGKVMDSESGLGVLSVYPIVQTGFISLPCVPDDNDRKVQQVEVTLPGGTKMAVTNVHLTHLGNANGLRNAQAEALATVVRSDKTYPHHLICGDFNAVIDSTEIKTFRQLSRATDCYVAGQGTEPRYSLLDPFKAGKRICVDHIFSIPLQGENSYPEFINSGIVLDGADPWTGLYASDHFGICTTLVIQ
ncbi:MAG TPA: endonuclease/exonuclease/phosphatase family protein [Mucilaginibacter sp.]|jgi:endonuclease/exonuclease/phosphatase family metal-dependent hydrolase|nr:endonuclease/exonuclease/phosphatase family protein [Mucilaginibacter sp.]